MLLCHASPASNPCMMASRMSWKSLGLLYVSRLGFWPNKKRVPDGVTCEASGACRVVYVFDDGARVHGRAGS